MWCKKRNDDCPTYVRVSMARAVFQMINNADHNAWHYIDFIFNRIIISSPPTQHSGHTLWFFVFFFPPFFSAAFAVNSAKTVLNILSINSKEKRGDIEMKISFVIHFAVSNETFPDIYSYAVQSL
jgi:hypothetical protein